MERSHSVSSGSTHQDDSWTCQRCGWVYPNAHPSAKHRRNHKKQCGKIKGFELRSEHKAGSSDDASSDDESHVKMDNLPPQSRETQHDGTKPIEGSAVPAPSALLSTDLPVNEVNVSSKVKPDAPVLPGLSASTDANPDVRACESIENVLVRDVAKSESSAPEHVPSTVSLDKTAKVLGEGNLMHATLADEVEVPALVLPGLATNESKVESVEQDAKFEDAPLQLTRERDLETAEGRDILGHASKVDGAEAVARDSPGVDFDLEKSEQKKDVRSEGSSHERTQSIASLDESSRKPQEQSKVSLTPCVDQVEIGSAPEHTHSAASLDEPSRTVQEQSKVRLTPYAEKVEIAAQVSRGLDSEQARETHKESSSILKQQAVNRQGSSVEDDSWTCNRCGWVYPNPHPSAKHRRNHKKQCGKIRAFELRTEPHKGGSSDEVSSDEDIHAKKEHLPHQSPQISKPQDQANNPAGTGSTPPDVDTLKLTAEHLPHLSPQILEAQDQDNNPAATGSTPPAAFGEGKISTESDSRDLSASKGDAHDKELSAMPNLKDISTPDIKSSDVIPELPQNTASLAQLNPSEGESKKGAALEQVMVVPCGPDGSDASQTKELPKLSSLKEEILSNPAVNVQEILGTHETRLNAVPSLPKSVNDSANEVLDDYMKDTPVESGPTNKLAETSDGLLGDCTPNIASIPSVPDSLPSASSPYAENFGASILKVDDPSLVVISATDPRASGSSNETLDGSAGVEVNQSAILKEGKDVSEDPMLVGLDASSDLKNLDASSDSKNLDALDDTLVRDPLKRETMDTMPGGLKVKDGLVALDNISSDLYPPTLTADKVLVENMPVKKNLLLPTVSSAADDGLANDAEEGKSLSVQASKNPVELLTKNESLSEIVEQGNDPALSTSIDKADETTHSSEKQWVPTVVAEMDNPNDVITPDTTPEAKPIQERLDTPGYVELMNIPLGSEDLGQGAALVSAGRNAEIPNADSSITKGSYVSDNVKKNDAAGTLPLKNGRQAETVEASGAVEAVEKREAKEGTLCEASGAPVVVQKPEVKEDTPCEVRGIESCQVKTEEARGALEVVEKREVKEDSLCETRGAQEAEEKPKVIEGTPCEARGIGSYQVEIEEARGALEVVEKGEAKEDTLREGTGAPEGVEKAEVKGDTLHEARGIGSYQVEIEEASSAPEAVQKQETKEDTLREASGAPEAVEKPEFIEDTPCEARGIGSSDLSYSETSSVTRAETGVSGRLGLGASAHRLSDSLEIYEDAQDSLETCSVGGSVEENESLDEPRQTFDDIIPEEPKHLVALLDERVPGGSVGLDKESHIMNGISAGEANSESNKGVPGESVGLDKDSSILNGSSAGKASFEEKSLSDKRVPSESVGLDKEPSILNGSSAGEASSEGKATTLPKVSYTVRSEMEDLKAPSPEAWQEPGPSNFKYEGKKISTSEVTEDGKSGESSHTALRSLMAKEGPEKADQFVETITPEGDLKGLKKTGGSLGSGNGRKPKSRSFWSHCICCPTVH